jgi:hypothetical protein
LLAQVLNHAVEFGGGGVAALGVEARMTIANMTTEWGALAGVGRVGGWRLHGQLSQRVIIVIVIVVMSVFTSNAWTCIERLGTSPVPTKYEIKTSTEHPCCDHQVFPADEVTFRWLDHRARVLEARDGRTHPRLNQAAIADAAQHAITADHDAVRTSLPSIATNEIDGDGAGVG